MTYPSSILFSNEDDALLNLPYPERQCAIQQEVHQDCPEGTSLCGIPTQLVVHGESDSGNDDSTVTQD